MMLDMKRTFDEVVREPGQPGEGAADPGRTPSTSRCRARSRARRSTWRWRSSASSTRDAQARPARYDLIVVDTPPSRSALDFLDAPERLSSFLDGRFIRLLLAPAQGPGAADDRRASGMVTNALTKILGAQVLQRHADVRGRLRHPLRRLPAAGAADLRAAPGRRDGVPGGRRARAGRAARGGVLRRAAQRGPDAAGRPGRQPGQPARPTATCRPTRRWPASSGCARQGDGARPDGRAAAAARRPDAGRRARGAAARAGSRRRTREVPTAVVPALATDVHDLDGLRRVGELLRRRRPRAGSTRVRRRSVVRRRLDCAVLGLRGLEHACATRRVGPTAQQRPALTLGHAAPDAPLDLVVERLGQALGAHGAAARTAAWPCSARPRARRARPAVPAGTRPRRPVFNPHDDVPTFMGPVVVPMTPPRLRSPQV